MKGKMALYSAHKSYFRSSKGKVTKHNVNKQYYDSIRNINTDCSTHKYLANSRIVLDNIVSQTSKKLSNFTDKDTPSHNSNSILQSIREHKASAAVCKRFNKDIEKKLGTNRKSTNAPLNIIAPGDTCQSVFKNMHNQPLSHVKSQALVKFCFHAKIWLKSEFLTMTDAEIKDKASDICPNFTFDNDDLEANIDYMSQRLIMDYLHLREKWSTNLSYTAYQTKQFADGNCGKLSMAQDIDATDIVLGNDICIRKISFLFFHSIILKMVFNMILRKEII